MKSGHEDRTAWIRYDPATCLSVCNIQAARPARASSEEYQIDEAKARLFFSPSMDEAQANQVIDLVRQSLKVPKGDWGQSASLGCAPKIVTGALGSQG